MVSPAGMRFTCVMTVFNVATFCKWPCTSGIPEKPYRPMPNRTISN